MLELKGLTRTYGTQSAVDEMDLTIPDGEFFCLLGPSGCGKTTTLRMIAGFELPNAGQILLNGQDLTQIPPHKRSINTVFQNYALFPHLNVYENVAFGLRLQKLDESEIKDRVHSTLKMVALEGLGNRSTRQLSGGQQQRVTLARALVNRPEILLLDEPLGALDEKLRLQMQVELSNLQREVGITFIFITHNQEEALTMADRIAVMDQGRILQVGTPDDIYLKPNSRFVADFIGQMNFLPARDIIGIDEGVEIYIDEQEGFVLRATQPLKDKEMHFGIRPEQLRLSRTAPTPGENGFPGLIRNEVFYGDSSMFMVEIPTGHTLAVMHQNYLPSGTNPESFQEGDNIYVCWSVHAGCLLTDQPQ